MTQRTLTTNQPRFSIRTYSLGAASVLLAYACLTAGPVATANTTTGTAITPSSTQTRTTSSTGQDIKTQVSQSTSNQSSTNQTSTTTSIQSTPSSYQEKSPAGTTTSSTQVTTPSSSPATPTSSQQTTPASQESQSQTKQTKTNQNQTNTSSASSSAISQKNTSQSQTRNSQSPTTNQARTATVQNSSTRSTTTGSISQGDDYPYKTGWQIDPWGLYTRQCTSFVAYRLSSVNGFTLPRAYGNADVWGTRAQSEGYRVDMNPALGAVAWWNTMHVAWVTAIDGDRVEIEEYNYNYSESYHRRWISKNSVSGYIHFKDLSSSSITQTKPTTSNSSSLASSGTYTFTQQAPIKNEAKQSSPTIDYYYSGETVRYDKVLTADGYQWISYLSYSGARRYIPIKQITTTQVAQPSTQANNQLPTSGTYTFRSRASVRNQPSLSAAEITYYNAGSIVRYDKVVTSEGRQWISYISYSGARRYIAIP
ncbi:CHAP domain-containing protein [Streptococcus suis]|nr:CHAP domain-containing protein [Streptococcus suis]